MTYNERHIFTLQKEFTELGYDPNTIMRDGATYSIRSGQVTFDTWDRTVTPVLVPSTVSLLLHLINMPFPTFCGG